MPYDSQRETLTRIKISRILISDDGKAIPYTKYQSSQPTVI